ncbi:MAG: dephospho-CoA kinase [Pseudanabaenaceae cyanobacterium SKYGB_i_bin29]|nr:dephospho-CoA kinase [Pseudanabaenaceae cyanobacterium SKYG29]MDW8422576.1 dephospho-CoA kinase [Pseudanabaenaceae cyanobacterium SKYGB_i_bin29]
MRIGLTGGIACGKSTVAHYLQKKYGVPVLSADRYAHSILETVIKEAVIDRYGAGILQGGKIDRQRLGQIVFQAEQERRWLEQQIHPLVRTRMLQDAQQYQGTVVLEIPLLFEAQMTDLVDRIWVVACSEATALARLQQRNHLTLLECQQRLQAQIPIAAKIRQADVVLYNEGTLEELYQQVDRTWQSLVS